MTKDRLLELVRLAIEDLLTEEIHDSVAAVGAFLNALPDDRRLPRIAPDGEGGILLAWKHGDQELVMDVCGWMLFPVVNPTRNPLQIADTHFDGIEIPATILSYIPLN